MVKPQPYEGLGRMNEKHRQSKLPISHIEGANGDFFQN